MVIIVGQGIYPGVAFMVAQATSKGQVQTQQFVGIWDGP